MPQIIDAHTAAAMVKEGTKVLFGGFLAVGSADNIIDQIVQKAVDHFGHLDILLNNAGLLRREKALDFSEKDWDDVMNVNLKSLFFLSQAVARQFVKQGTGGKIINIASLISFQGGRLLAGRS